MSALAPDSSLRGLSSCGCGTGLGAATPVAIDNRPGLTAVAYRAGTHGRFLTSLLAGLSSAGRPAHPLLVGRVEHGDQPVRRRLVGTEEPEVVRVPHDHVAEELAQHARVLGVDGAG